MSQTYQGPDRVVLTVQELMGRGIGYDEALRRIAVGDAVHDRADALMDAVSLARECLCIRLDGPEEWAQDAKQQKAAFKLQVAWLEFQEAIGEAQRIVGVA